MQKGNPDAAADSADASPTPVPATKPRWKFWKNQSPTPRENGSSSSDNTTKETLSPDSTRRQSDTLRLSSSSCSLLTTPNRSHSHNTNCASLTPSCHEHHSSHSPHDDTDDDDAAAVMEEKGDVLACHMQQQQQRPPRPLPPPPPLSSESLQSPTSSSPALQQQSRRAITTTVTPNRRLGLGGLIASNNTGGRRQQRPPHVLPDDPNFSVSCNGRNGWRWEDLYARGEELGSGAFGTVFVGKRKTASGPVRNELDLFSSGLEWDDVAIKKAEPNALDRRGGRTFETYDDLEMHCHEIRILVRLKENTTSARDSNVLFLYEFFMSGKYFYMVTERLGQELEEWKSKCDVFTEKMAIDISRTILNAISFMVSKDVVHRDIKLQNIMFRKNGDFRTLKIVDFGLATVLGEGDAARDFCGSIGYIAPEIYIGKAYRFEVDMFAFGVVLFRLLSGERPFPSNNQEILKQHTIELRYNVQGKDWESVSSPSKDLVRRLLINRQERLTAEQALDHPWFSEEGKSVLRPDLSHFRPATSRSKAFAYSYAPTATEAPGDEAIFWIDGSIEMALATIISYEIYHCRVVDKAPTSRQDESAAGMICIEEMVSPIAAAVPEYIGWLPSYTEKDCRQICLELTKCIDILHNAGIAHRNLNLGNILIDPFGKISLKGLLYAQPISEKHPLTGHFGDLYSWYAFTAPEIDVDFFHDKSVDLWSLGAIIYMLLTGLPPFRGNGADLIDGKHKGIFDFDIAIPSGKAQRLIQGLLRVDPKDRYTIEDVLNDEWMLASDDYLENFDLKLALDGMRDWETL